jgi:hypothetical protein
MQLIVKVRDDFENGNITDAGFDFFTVSTNSILEIAENNSLIEYYPNPVIDRLTVKIESAGIVQLFAINGYKVGEFNLEKGQQEIDFSAFESGIYFLQFEETTFRILKQ